MTIRVDIGELGATCRPVILEDDATVKDALKAADITDTNISVSVQGRTVDMSEELEDGDTVVITKSDIKQG